VDGFYRVWVRANDVPNLGMLFPSMDGEEYLIGFPLALPMGWTESPKIFTTATETVADLVNNSLTAGTTFGTHPLEVLSEAPPHLSRWIPLRPPQRRLRSVSLNPHPYIEATASRALSITARPSPYGTSMSTTFCEWCRAGLEPAIESNVPSCTRWTRNFSLEQQRLGPPPVTGFHQQNGKRRLLLSHHKSYPGLDDRHAGHHHILAGPSIG
jgi:hypothetical protein